MPDGSAWSEALARTTDLGVVAHPDDLELLALPGILACVDDPARSFAGVVCTDGAGSVRAGPVADLSDGELAEVRWVEQCEAAVLGRYGAVAGLGRSSADIRSVPGQMALIDELVEIIDAARPVNVYTHNPADSHESHVAVVAAVIHAIRRLPWSARPHRLVGVEGWRGLDWLAPGETLRLDVSGHGGLADDLLAAHRSQIDAGKRYDAAARGRRHANATFGEPRSADRAEEVVLALDLSPLIHNDDLDPVAFVLSAIDRFRDDVDRSWSRWFG